MIKWILPVALILALMVSTCGKKATQDNADSTKNDSGVTIALDENNTTIINQIDPNLHGEDSAFAVAQIIGDPNEQIVAYEALIRDYPDGKRVCDCHFMMGFIYSEKLNDKEKATAKFKQVIKDYPNCEWADDAKWMLDDLQGGELTKKVMEQIEKNIKDTNKTKTK